MTTIPSSSDSKRSTLARLFDQQRHLEKLRIEPEAVREETLLAQVLTMVGGHHDQRVIEQISVPKDIEQATELFIDVLDLGLVGVA